VFIYVFTHRRSLSPRLVKIPGPLGLISPLLGAMLQSAPYTRPGCAPETLPLTVALEGAAATHPVARLPLGGSSPPLVDATRTLGNVEDELIGHVVCVSALFIERLWLLVVDPRYKTLW
jgi:hypothetical protein